MAEQKGIRGRMQSYYFEFLNDDGENEVFTDTEEKDGKPPKEEKKKGK